MRSAERGSPRTGTILLVEDDPDIRLSLVELLTDEGYHVQAAVNGQDALDYLRQAPSLPKLILLDLMMPVKDGFQFREEQLLDPELAGIPTIIVSADAHIAVKAAKAGVSEFLRKPVDLKALFSLLTRYCN